MAKMTLSVSITTFNGAPLVRACVASVTLTVTVVPVPKSATVAPFTKCVY